MTKTIEIKEFLESHPGYLKWGKGKLAKRFKVSEGAIQGIKEWVKRLRNEEEVIFNKVKAPKVKGVKFLKEPSITPIKGFRGDPRNVLVIPDTHFPFEKEGILEHCLAMQRKYNCGTVVHIGDEVDLCGVSQWEKDPDGFSPGTEASLAQEKMKVWYKAFPKVSVCIGNHTARPFRMAKANGIPKKFIKSYEEAWEAPEGWKWSDHWVINDVLYTHGTGFSGANAAIKIASMHRQNTVIGHIHSQAGIQYSASRLDLVWGMQVGGALDDKAYAAFYAKDQLSKSIVGCGVVLDGKLPIYEPMIM